MANWTNLKAAIAETITTNGNQEITGAVLQNTLNAIVNAISENAAFAGVATPTTNPGVPDGPVFYLAGISGIYSNFGVTLQNELAVITNTNNGSWVKSTVTSVATTGDIEELEKELIARIQGKSKNSDAAKDPFKFLGSFTRATGGEFLNALNAMHGTVAGVYDGLWRALIGASPVEIYNFAIYYKDDRWIQVLKSPYRWGDGDFDIINDTRYRTIYRIHENGAWGEWGDTEKELEKAISAETRRAKNAEQANRQLIADLVGESPETLDTIHEISSWILNDKTGAAAMAKEINENRNNIDINKNNIANNSIAIGNEKYRAIKAEKTLQKNIDNTNNVVGIEEKGRFVVSIGAVMKDGSIYSTNNSAYTKAFEGGDIAVTNEGYYIYDARKVSADGVAEMVAVKSRRLRTEKGYTYQLNISKDNNSTFSKDELDGIVGLYNYDSSEIEKNKTDIQYLFEEAVKSDSFEVEELGDGIGINYNTFDGNSGSIEIPFATEENGGFMSAKDKKKLDAAASVEDVDKLNIAIYTNALNSQTGGNLFDKNAVGILVDKIFLDTYGNIKDRAGYNITDYMAVIPGESYYCQQIATKPHGYDLDKTFKQAIDYSNGVFTIPEGVYWIRLSYSQGWANTFCINKGVTALPVAERAFGLIRTKKLYDAAVTTEKLSDNAVTIEKLSEELKERVLSLPTVVKKNGAFIKKGDLPSGSVWEFPQNSVEVGEYMTFSANIVGDFNALYIGHDKTGGAYMKITANEVVLCSHVVSPMSEKTFEHGLTIENNIQVYIEKKLNAVVSIKVVSNGVSSDVFSDGYWYANKGTPFVENDGCELADCSFGWTCKAINSDIWAFGDSYFGVNGTIRWMAYLVSAGHTNLVVNGYGGQGSVSAYTDLTNLLTIGTPKKILWCLGMNDKDSSTAVNANWLNTYNSLKALCENNNIELILATIPTVPSRINKFKNDIIRSSGCRYIDFDKAVGADEGTGAWFGDMLSTDGVHPSETGALALYNRAIADMPELLNC